MQVVHASRRAEVGWHVVGRSRDGEARAGGVVVLTLLRTWPARGGEGAQVARHWVEGWHVMWGGWACAPGWCEGECGDVTARGWPEDREKNIWSQRSEF